VAQTTTDGKGAYSFAPLAPSENTSYRVDAGRIHSIVLRERVAPAIKLAQPAAGVPAGQPLTLTGSVTPATAARSVYLEREGTAGLTFHPIAVASVASDGSFSIAHVFLSPGAATLRVAVPDTGTYAAGLGEPFGVQVTAAAPGAAAPAYVLAQ
jgi:hypothetical protein